MPRPAPIAATLERFPLVRRARGFSKVRLRNPEPHEYTVTRITWSAGDDELAWHWTARSAEGRLLAYGDLATQDEAAVIKQCGESGADVAEECEWRMET